MLSIRVFFAKIAKRIAAVEHPGGLSAAWMPNTAVKQKCMIENVEVFT